MTEEIRHESIRDAFIFNLYTEVENLLSLTSSFYNTKFILKNVRKKESHDLSPTERELLANLILQIRNLIRKIIYRLESLNISVDKKIVEKLFETEDIEENELENFVIFVCKKLNEKSSELKFREKLLE